MLKAKPKGNKYASRRRAAQSPHVTIFPRPWASAIAYPSPGPRPWPNRAPNYLGTYPALKSIGADIRPG